MKLLSFFILSCLFFISDSYAFKFSPMSASIGIKNQENSSLFYLENDSDQPIAVQVTLAKREMDLNGVETNSKIGNELTVYPSQLIIPAGEKRSVKVSWAGKEIPSKELSYRMIAEQLPIDLDKSKNKKASIKVLLRYVAALYVGTEDFSSDVSVKEVKVDEKKVSIELENAGKKHQVLTNLALKFKGKKDQLLKGEELKGMAGENILAQSKRIFIFNRSGKFSDVNSSDKVLISFDKD